MSSWKKLGKLLTGSAARKRMRKEQGKDEPFDRSEEEMSDREKAYREAYRKKEEKDKFFKDRRGYKDGGTKFEKILKKIKKKK